MQLLEQMMNRRSTRTYTGEHISEEALTNVLRAGLLAPNGRGLQAWEFVVVRDRETLKALSTCRPGGTALLADADCVIVVLGDESKTDVWVEDCSIAMANMLLMADAQGLGCCWSQGRNRTTPDGAPAEEYVRNLLGFPEHVHLEAFLALGMPVDHPEARKLEELPMEKIHWEKF